MSDERIDIEINDKIDPSIPTKLSAIATGATAGHTAVQKLKAELASINDTPTRRLADATNSVTNAVNRELGAQRSLKGARDASASAADRIAAAVDRGLAKNAALASSATAAYNAAAAGEARLAGSRAVAARQTEIMRQSTQGLAAARSADATAATRSVSAQSQQNGILGRAMALYDGVRDAIYQLSRARQTDAAASRVQQVAANGAAVATARNGLAAQNARIVMLDLTHVGINMGQMLASGVNPMRALVMESGRLATALQYANGSVLTLTRSLFAMLAPFAPIIAVIAAAAIAFKVFQSDINERHGPELKKYSETLGLTSKEMKKLGDESVTTTGKIKEFDNVTVTAGDMIQGLWKTIAERTGVDKSLHDLKTAIVHYVREAVSQAADAFAVMYGEVVGTYRAIVKIWQNFPGMLGDAFIQAANKAIDAIERLVNGSINAVNRFASGANKLIGIDLFGQIGDVTLKRLERKAGVAGQSIKGVIRGEIASATAEGRAAISSFMKDWEKNSVQAAKDRLAKTAGIIKGDRTPPKPKKDTDPKTKADYLADTNKKLDDELARMHMLKDAREEQQRLDQIEEEFLKRRQPLTATEIEGFRQKIHAIQEYKYVQAELDRIVEEAQAPQRTYNATLQAAKEALDKGAISADRYGQELVKAKRTLEAATDPFFQFKEQLISANAALGKFGIAAQQAAYYEQLRQAALAKGIELSPQYVAGVNGEVDALMRKNNELIRAQQLQSNIQSTVGGIADPIAQDQMMLQNKQAYYDALNQMADQNHFNEAQRRQALGQLDLMYNEKRLAGARSMFATLATLSSSGNKKLAAIGKAAAIAQAVIDGALAVQKALSSVPPPWNIPLAIATGAVAAVQVATIASTNVGGFATGGQFMVDGRAGVDRNNINMNVSRGERVTVETPAQQRANDGGGGSSQTIVPVKIINNLDPADMIDMLDSGEYDHVIVNAVSRNANKITQLVGRSS
jgi:hypothetical protein